MGLDAHVPQLNQLVAMVLTTVVAAASVLAVTIFSLRRAIFWPYLIIISGTVTFLMEPLYDHLYGLWFFGQGQLNAVTTYGIHVPLWLPIIYMAYYGCSTTWYWNQFERGLTMRGVFTYFTISVLLAGSLECFYINVVGLYNYQSHQPFVVWNYPVFVAVMNGVPPFLAAIILYRLVPLLKGWENLTLLGVLPFAFASNTFGSGFLYLAVRHMTPAAPPLLLDAAAISSAVGAYVVIWLAARMAGVSRASGRARLIDVDTKLSAVDTSR
jgi:hypothetical protein